MPRDALIQWGMTLIVFGWLATIAGLAFCDWQASKRHRRECRALKEAREIVRYAWARERIRE
jgi:hypothetical protein